MVPPQEHCQGERSAHNSRLKTACDVQTDHWQLPSQGWFNQRAQLPVPNAHLPAGASVELEMRTEILGTITLWIQGFTNHIGCKWLRSPSALGSCGVAGTHWNTHGVWGQQNSIHWCRGTPRVSPGITWEQCEPPVGGWPPSRALPPCSQMTISIKAEGPERGRCQMKNSTASSGDRFWTATGLHLVSNQSPEAMPSLIKIKTYSSTCCAALYSCCSLVFQFVK